MKTGQRNERTCEIHERQNERARYLRDSFKVIGIDKQQNSQRGKMSDLLKQLGENKIFIWLVTAIIAGAFGFYVNTLTGNVTFDNRITVIEAEIQSLKIRQGQLELGLQTKADQAVIDDCIKDLTLKLDRMYEEQNRRFDRMFEIITKIKQ